MSSRNTEIVLTAIGSFGFAQTEFAAESLRHAPATRYAWASALRLDAPSDESATDSTVVEVDGTQGSSLF